MAKTATVQTPAAPDADEEFEVVLPEAEEQSVRLEDEEPEAETPSADKKPSPETKPSPTAKQPPPDEPEATKQEEKAALLARAKEDRLKRKEYARRYQDVLSELDRAREELARARSASRDGADTKTVQYWQRRVAELKDQADKADSMGALAELTLNAVWQEMERRQALLNRRLRESEYAHGLALSQLNTRVRHQDYDAVLTESGVAAALEVQHDGNWKDSVIGRAVYFTRDGELTADPYERAYQLGFALLHGKQAYEELAGEDEALRAKIEGKGTAQTSEERPKAEQPPSTKAATSEAEAAAERRGARRVIEQVEGNAKKPVGIRGIRSAGAPGRGVTTFAELDRLAEENPQEWQRVLKANPDLERRYLGG